MARLIRALRHGLLFARRAGRSRLDGWRQQLADVENTPGLGLLCVLGAITGALAGLVILALYAAILAIRTPLFAFGSALGDTFIDAGVLFRITVPLFGALLLGLIVEWRLKTMENGIVHVIERLMYYQGQLPLRTALIDFGASALAIATGQSVGREGTAAHIGAATGSFLGRRLALPNNSVRTLVGCGTAGGIAASFDTPLAAVIFAMEVVMMEYTIAGFAPIILAAVTGSLVTLPLASVHPHFVAATVRFSALELPYMVLVGAVLGVLGAVFTRLAGATVPVLARIRVSLRMALAGLVTGLLAVVFPQIMGLGFETVNTALAGQFMAGAAVGIGLAKLLATLFAVGAAVPGGVILPMFVVGSTLGSAFGSLGAALLPGQASGPGLYALLGIGAMVAAVLQAPLSALVALLELSDQTAVVLPGMLVIIAALVVSRRMAASDSLFRLLLRRRGLDYRNDPISQYLRRASVLSAMNRRFRIVDHRVGRALIDEILGQNIDWLLIRSAESRPLLMRPRDVARVATADAGAEEIINLMDIPAHRGDTQSIDVRASLQEAHDQFEQTEAEALVVQRAAASANGRPVTYGILTREAVAGSYRR